MTWHDASLTAGRHGKAAAFEDLQHRHIFGQHLGNERLEPGRSRNLDQVSDQVCRDAQPLVGVVDRERDLGAPGCETIYLEPPTITCWPLSESTATSAT